MIWADGRKYSGQWLHGIQQGKGEMRMADGKLKIGLFKNNLFIEEIKEVDEGSEDSETDNQVLKEYCMSTMKTSQGLYTNQRLQASGFSMGSFRSCSQHSEGESQKSGDFKNIPKSPVFKEKSASLQHSSSLPRFRKKSPKSHLKLAKHNPLISCKKSNSSKKQKFHAKRHNRSSSQISLKGRKKPHLTTIYKLKTPIPKRVKF